MTIPYVPEDLLQVGDYEVVSSDNNTLIVDNWYKNYDLLHSVLINTPAPRWKWSPGGRNFVDYYDCRPSLRINFPDKGKIQQFFDSVCGLVSKHFSDAGPLRFEGEWLDFNFYKNKRQGVPNTLQHHPHKDYKYNCIVFLDQIASGGTAIYPKLTDLPDCEEQNLLMDVSGFDKTIIPARPNRLVVFPGDQYHGGYIENHDLYVDHWRMNQVFFLDQPSSK